MIWIATAAVFGLVVCLVIYVAGRFPVKVNVAERIGGHTVTVPPTGRIVEGDDLGRMFLSGRSPGDPVHFAGPAAPAEPAYRFTDAP